MSGFPPDLIRLLVFDYVAPKSVQTAVYCSMVNKQWRRALTGATGTFGPECSMVNPFVQRVLSLNNTTTACPFCTVPHCNTPFCGLKIVYRCDQELRPHFRMHCRRVCDKKREVLFWKEVISREKKRSRKKCLMESAWLIGSVVGLLGFLSLSVMSSY